MNTKIKFYRINYQDDIKGTAKGFIIRFKAYAFGVAWVKQIKEKTWFHIASTVEHIPTGRLCRTHNFRPIFGFYSALDFAVCYPIKLDELTADWMIKTTKKAWKKSAHTKI